MFGLNKKKMIDLFKWLTIVTGITALVVGIAFGVIFSIRIRNYRSDTGSNVLSKMLKTPPSGEKRMDQVPVIHKKCLPS